MAATDTTVAVITVEQIGIINRARDTLQEIERAATAAAWGARNDAGFGPPYPQSFGRVSGVANAADDLLFDVLNIANAGKVADIDDDLLHNRKRGA